MADELFGNEFPGVDVPSDMDVTPFRVPPMHGENRTAVTPPIYIPSVGPRRRGLPHIAPPPAVRHTTGQYSPDFESHSMRRVYWRRPGSRLEQLTPLRAAIESVDTGGVAMTMTHITYVLF